MMVGTLTERLGYYDVFGDEEFRYKKIVSDKLEEVPLIRGESIFYETKIRLPEEHKSPKLLHWIYDNCLNPFSLALIFGSFTGVLSGRQGPFESELANYALFFSEGAAFGGFFGWIISEFKKACSPIKYRKRSI